MGLPQFNQIWPQIETQKTDQNFDRIYVFQGGTMAAPKWQLGRVRWFDDLKGEGVIRDENGQSFFVHYSAIETDKKRKSLKKGKEVKFQLLEDSHFTQVDKVKEI